jgi:hypothetical protein
MAKREEKADTDRPLTLLHELASDIINSRNMIRIKRMTEAKGIGE